MVQKPGENTSWGLVMLSHDLDGFDKSNRWLALGFLNHQQVVCAMLFQKKETAVFQLKDMGEIDCVQLDWICRVLGKPMEVERLFIEWVFSVKTTVVVKVFIQQFQEAILFTGLWLPV